MFNVISIGGVEWTLEKEVMSAMRVYIHVFLNI
jgi:hypothetical protein